MTNQWLSTQKKKRYELSSVSYNHYNYKHYNLLDVQIEQTVRNEPTD